MVLGTCQLFCVYVLQAIVSNKWPYTSKQQKNTKLDVEYHQEKVIHSILRSTIHLIPAQQLQILQLKRHFPSECWHYKMCSGKANY